MTHTLQFYATTDDQCAGVSCASHELDLHGLMPSEEYADTRRADLFAVSKAMQMMATTYVNCAAAEVHIGDLCGANLVCGEVSREDTTLKANYFG